MKWIHNQEQVVWTDVCMMTLTMSALICDDVIRILVSVYRGTGGRVVEGTLANIV